MHPEHGAMRFTEEQQAVIDHGSGPALVVAGAGSGKTTSLVARIRRLLQAGVHPNSILMVTFSRRGAADMRRRAVRMAVPAGVQYRTLHSVAYEIVRAAPLTKEVIVPKKWQVTRVIKDTLNEIERDLGPGSRAYLPKPRDVRHEIELAKAAMIWPLSVDRDTGEVLSGPWHSAVEDRTYPDYIEWATTRRRAPIPASYADIINQVYLAIEQACQAPEAAGFDKDAGTRWVTFSDMVAVVSRAILRAERWVRDWYAYKPVMLIDEVQDNAPVNWVTCEFLAGPGRHIMCVGDDMQSIFGFRGARPELMQEFLARHPDAVTYPLTVNFRSGSAIIDAANRLLDYAPSTLSQGLVCGTGREGLIAGVSYGDGRLEADGIVDDIEAAIRDGVDPDEISVLYRINACAGPLEMACIKRGIAYRVAGSSYFKRGEIKAALGYLACAIDPEDGEGWRACANAPTRYLGNRFFERNPSLKAARDNLSVNGLGRWASGARKAFRAVKKVQGWLEAGGAAFALRHVFETLGVRKHFREEAAAEEDETDVEEACAVLIATARVVKEPETLIKFARDMASTGFEDGQGDERDQLPRVTLSTIHKAKGLEWGIVYVPGMTPGLLPLSDAPEDEERRLAYVATTRAKDRCFVSWGEMSSHGQVVGPSKFVHELGLMPWPEEENEAETDTAPASEEGAGEHVERFYGADDTLATVMDF